MSAPQLDPHEKAVRDQADAAITKLLVKQTEMYRETLEQFGNHHDATWGLMSRLTDAAMAAAVLSGTEVVVTNLTGLVARLISDREQDAR